MSRKTWGFDWDNLSRINSMLQNVMALRYKCLGWVVEVVIYREKIILVTIV